MGVPKRKTSKAKKQSRIRSHKHALPALQVCAKSGAPKQPHRVCPSCGYYNNRQVLTISADE